MSVLVDLADLPRTLADFDRGYLLTTREGRVKAVSVRAVVDGDTLVVVAPGRGSVLNLAATPDVTLLFAPPVAGGMTLLVDGTATAEGDDVWIAPSNAVLHKSVG